MRTRDELRGSLESFSAPRRNPRPPFLDWRGWPSVRRVDLVLLDEALAFLVALDGGGLGHGGRFGFCDVGFYDSRTGRGSLAGQDGGVSNSKIVNRKSKMCQAALVVTGLAVPSARRNGMPSKAEKVARLVVGVGGGDYGDIDADVLLHIVDDDLGKDRVIRDADMCSCPGRRALGHAAEVADCRKAPPR